MVAPVIFLDIDGVLNSARWFSERAASVDPDGMTHEQYQIDPTAVAHLNRIVAATGAKIVVSSTWRILHPLEEIEATIRSRGLDVSVEFIGKTPERDSRTRGEEIQDWIDIHESWIDHIGPFVIVDDDSDMAHLAPFLVQTTFAEGLTEAHVERCIALLGGAR